VYQQNCQSCHGPIASDRTAPALVTPADREQHPGGRAGFDAGRDPVVSPPAKDDAVVSASDARGRRCAGGAVDDAPGRRGGAGGTWRRARGSGAAGTDRRIRIRVDASRAPGRRDVARCAVPDGVPQYERPVINEYNTVGNRIAPPFTSIVKYDLNVPAIKWRVGFGDDPELARAGSPARAHRAWSTA
jgi:hypothetical protein